MNLVNTVLGYCSTDMGIDLGTANTLVCVKGRGIVIAEPSVVAVKKGTNKVLLNGDAVGNTAKEMLGKTPGSIEAIRPLKNGVIADFEVTECMLSYFIRKAQPSRWGLKPRCIIAVPSGITAVERQAVINSAERAGARKVFLVPEPMASGIGVGLPITEAMGSMIVDIGGGTTEVAVLSLAGLVTAESLRIAGDQFDESIIQYMRSIYNLMIGEQTAERIKVTIGSAYPVGQEATMEVAGRDLQAGLPRRVVVHSEEVREALKKPIDLIVDTIRLVLEKTSPELAADLMDRGLSLAGGGALLRGLDLLISQEIGLPVHVAEDPLTAVARGTYQILEHIDLLNQILECTEEDS
jgi:rod shape-determining protein MreB